MYKSYFAAALATFTLFAVTGSDAADFTAAGADQIKATFEQYLGRSAAGRPARVVVEAEASDYKITLNLQSIVDSLLDLLPRTPQTSGIAAEFTPVQLKVSPLGDGTWKVTEVGRMRISYAVPEQSGSYEMNGLVFDGIYDPAILAYRSQTAKIANFSTQSTAIGLSAGSEAHDMVWTGTGSAGASGTMDGHISQTAAGGSQSVLLTVPSGAGHPSAPVSSAPVSIDAKFGRNSRDTVLKALRLVQAGDLLSFLVAHPSKQELTDHQPDLKSKLLAVLPLFDTFSLVGDAADLTVQSNYGQGGVKSMHSNVAIDNRAGASRFDVGVKVEGVSVDSVYVPEDIHSLIPTAADIGFSLSGFDLAAGAAALVDAIDLTKTPAIKADVGPHLLHAILPTGALTYDLKPSTITGPDYTLGWTGTVQAGPQHVKLHVDVTASGLDSVIRSVQQIKRAEAASVAVGLYAAKALAKHGTDGALTWAIDFETGGLLLVNGSPVGPQKKI